MVEIIKEILKDVYSYPKYNINIAVLSRNTSLSLTLALIFLVNRERLSVLSFKATLIAT